MFWQKWSGEGMIYFGSKNAHLFFFSKRKKWSFVILSFVLCKNNLLIHLEKQILEHFDLDQGKERKIYIFLRFLSSIYRIKVEENRFSSLYATTDVIYGHAE